MRGRVGLGLGLVAALGVAACGADDSVSASTTSASGRILIAGSTGALRGAQVTVEQVEYLAGPPEVRIREYIDEITTDDNGAWSIDGRQLAGQYRLTFSGGAFTDPATGATVELDPADTIEAFLSVELATHKDDYLITPISVATAAAARARFASGSDERFGLALAFATEHVDQHFGGVHWADLQLADLTQPATSPTEGVRGAWVLGAIDTLARDIASAADASPNVVNPYRLTQAWAADLGRVDLPTFDGNDHDARGGGLLLGTECPAPDPACIVPPGCATGACRPACEIYSGTARVALAGALLSYARSESNRTGLPDSDALSVGRTIQENTDPVLFDPTACLEDLDRIGPVLIFDEPAPGFVRGAISVHASATDAVDRVPVVSFVGYPDQDGNVTDYQATTTIDTSTAGPQLSVRARAVDDAGNVTEIERSWAVDNLAPVLTVDPSGFFVDPLGHWWIRPPLTTGPTLTGTVTDDNGATVAAFRGVTLLATATVTGSTWALTLPPGTVSTADGVDVAIIATDPAGNPATQPLQLRYDDAPPVLAFVPTAVRDERSDGITFATAPDPTIGNLPSYNPTHNHMTAPVIALGATPAPACTPGAAPTVAKHAYLLDEAAPAYVSEIGDSAAGRNPLAFAFTLADPGVGLDLAYTAYRVRDVATDTTVLDWQPLPAGTPILDGDGHPIGRSHAVPLYRVGTTAPSIPALDAAGLYELQVRGRDQLGRDVASARCWNLQLLPSPIYVGPARQALSGPVGSGKYGFATTGGLSLADTSPPIDPVADQVLNDNAPGVGLVEFPVWNPTTEAVYVALDLTRPTGATYSKEVYDGYWAKYLQTMVNYDCGYFAGGPDTTLVGCSTASVFPAPTVTTTPTTAAAVTYSIRVFEEVSSSTVTELVPCTACVISSMPAPPSSTNRVVVQLPPRAAAPAPPRKFWVMPTAGSLNDELRPGGSPPYAEHTAGGLIMSGTYDQSRTVCKAYQSNGSTFNCVERAIFRRYKATTRASFTLVNPAVSTRIQVSRDGLSILDPTYLTTNMMQTRQLGFTGWLTAEPILPLPPTAP